MFQVPFMANVAKYSSPKSYQPFGETRRTRFCACQESFILHGYLQSSYTLGIMSVSAVAHKQL